MVNIAKIDSGLMKASKKFHTKVKKASASAGLSMIEFTDLMANDVDDCYARKLKGRKFLKGRLF